MPRKRSHFWSASFPEAPWEAESKSYTHRTLKCLAVKADIHVIHHQGHHPSLAQTKTTRRVHAIDMCKDNAAEFTNRSVLRNCDRKTIATQSIMNVDGDGFPAKVFFSSFFNSRSACVLTFFSFSRWSTSALTVLNATMYSWSLRSTMGMYPFNVSLLELATWLWASSRASICISCVSCSISSSVKSRSSFATVWMRKKTVEQIMPNGGPWCRFRMVQSKTITFCKDPQSLKTGVTILRTQKHPYENTGSFKPFHWRVKMILPNKCKRVGGSNPFEKYARQIGSFPQGSGWT